MPVNYWLFKSEPNEFSLHDLKTSPDQTTCWDGVRNYQARNFMRDDMQVGDPVLFYHSRTDPSVVGRAEVVRTAYPDPTAWEPRDKHFDPRSTPENPVWLMVDIQFVEEFGVALPLKALRDIPELREMMLLRKGSRLSIQPVTAGEFEVICRLGRGS